VDPPQTTRPPFFTARSATGTSAPTGAKMMAASSGSGGVSSDPPAQTAPSERANPAPPCPGAGERIDAAPCHAATCARICAAAAEPIDAECRPLACDAIAAPADQPGAHQWRKCGGVSLLGK